MRNIKMSGKDMRAAKALSQCNIRPMTFDKEFSIRIYMISRLKHKVNKSQLDNLWRLIYKYKKQIRDTKLIEEAEKRYKQGELTC